MTIMYYKLVNKEAVPCDNKEWSEFFGENENRIVKQSNIDEIFISTVFLGLDHNWRGGEPILFETMIFGGKHDQFQERYSTWDEAETGHHKACAMVLEKN